MVYFLVSKFKFWDNAHLSNLISTANIHKLEHKSSCSYLLGGKNPLVGKKKKQKRVSVNYIFVRKNVSCAKYAIPSAKLIAFIDQSNIFEHSSDIWLSKNLKKHLVMYFFVLESKAYEHFTQDI